jgi:HEPN domain-containing protein
MTRSKTYSAEAIIELAAPLLLGPEFVGLLKSARIGGVQVQIVLPDFERGKGEFRTVLHPRSRVDWLSSLANRTGAVENDPPFGGVVSWQGSAEILEFSVHRLLALPRGRITTAEARKLKLAVDGWVAGLETWIEVVAREDLHLDRVREDRQGQSAFVWLDRGKEPGELMPGRRLVTIDFGRRLSITPRQWGKTLAKTSDGEAPPEAHIFVRDARHALNIGHYRRSVLDAATAAELSLAKLRDDYLVANSNPRLAAHLRRRVRQIDGIATFLRSMGRNGLPERIREEIGDPRNDAIHAGHELDEETASAALKKAEEVVDQAWPWKRLL